MRWISLILVVLVLSACGQKGDLFLPEKAKKEEITKKEQQASQISK